MTPSDKLKLAREALEFTLGTLDGMLEDASGDRLKYLKNNAGISIHIKSLTDVMRETLAQLAPSAVNGEDAVLPYDVDVGGLKFGKGVKLQILVDAFTRCRKAGEEAHQNIHEALAQPILTEQELLEQLNTPAQPDELSEAENE